MLDIVESRCEEKLNDYFFSIPKSERDKVKYISMDMYNHYRTLMRLYFPKTI
ncbi:transposase, partial [Thomasclavelia ramosa]